MVLKTTPFDVVATLDSEARIAAYVTAALETGETASVTGALGTVATARAMTQIARDAGVSRASLFRALDSGGKLDLDTALRVMQAVGLRLQVTPVADSRTARVKASRPARRAPKS
jgi:probable addiction module antidote protein